MSVPTHPELWKKIEAYQLDDPDASLPFSARLARDNRWPAGFAARVVEEYKRFIYLLCISDKMLTPSDEVDRAWHLHMVYTRDYWQRFCAETLGREIHHQPTAGGPDDEAKFRQAYARTISFLTEEFDEAPPPDIWPSENVRFSPPEPLSRIDQARFYIFPKPEFRFTALASILWIGIGAAFAWGMLEGVEAMAAMVFGTVAVAIVVLPGRKGKDGGGGWGGGCGSGDGGCGGGCGGD